MSKAPGVTTGIVKSVDDPDGQGRILVDMPTLPGRTRSAWAPIAALMAGPGRGAFFMPELEDEVLIAFDGDGDRPYIVGFLWNGQDKPPSGHPRERMIRSRNGHTIRMLDSTPNATGAGAVVIEDANKNVITLSNGKIRIQAASLLELHADTIALSGPGWRRVISTIDGSPI
jgi:uncharacterized protein involved in type VI secretion and phage assembly